MRISSTIRRSTQVNRLGQAVHFQNRTRNWTEFGARIARLASGLAGIGVKPGDRVAMLALNSDRYLEYFFGRAAGPAPCSCRSTPGWRRRRWRYWLNDSGASVLLIDDTFAPMLPSCSGQCPRHPDPRARRPTAPPPTACSPTRALVDGHAHRRCADRGGDELAGLFYTGGTTGRSKGVMLSHRTCCSMRCSSRPLAGSIPAVDLPARRADVPPGGRRRRPSR